MKIIVMFNFRQHLGGAAQQQREVCRSHLVIFGSSARPEANGTTWPIFCQSISALRTYGIILIILLIHKMNRRHKELHFASLISQNRNFYLIVQRHLVAVRNRTKMANIFRCTINMCETQKLQGKWLTIILT
jgi:hypothetical protein